MYNKDYHKMISALVAEHRAYYKQAEDTFKKYMDVYNVDFWRGRFSNEIQIQVPDGNSFVEGYIASLFSKSPAVRIGPDIKASEGNADVAELVANHWLFDQFDVFTNATRLSLILPMAFFKLQTSTADVSALNKIQLSYLFPWDVMVDFNAASWDEMRWCGHVYTVTLLEARERWGNKEWKPSVEHIERADRKRQPANLPDELKYVSIVEFYDLQNNKRIFYSDGLASKIISIEDIPWTNVNGNAAIPIIPLYLCTKPNEPLKGFSTISKIYDQIVEKNLIRTAMAGQIRRDARLYLMKRGSLDEDAKGKLLQGEDMTFIDYEGENPGIQPVPTIPISSNYPNYLSIVEQDLARASVLAPFTRGEATRATATEVSALVQYSSAEIGKMARQRDAAIEQCAEMYLRMVAPLIDKDVILMNGSPLVLKPEMLEAQFKITAVDQLGTPLARATKKAELMSILPMLLQLGLAREEAVKQIAEAYDMPWLIEAIQKPQEQPQQASPSTTTTPQPQEILG